MNDSKDSAKESAEDTPKEYSDPGYSAKGFPDDSVGPCSEDSSGVAERDSRRTLLGNTPRSLGNTGNASARRGV